MNENVRIKKHTKYSLADLWIRFRFWLASFTNARPPFEVLETFTVDLDLEEECQVYPE